MRSGPEHVWITGEPGRWTVHYSGDTNYTIGPYRFWWAACVMKWILEDN